MNQKKVYKPRQKIGPSSKVLTKMEQPWTIKRVKRSMNVGNQEIKQIPTIKPNNIPTIKYNKIYTKQHDNTFKLSGYKCSLCHKLFSDNKLLETHPLLCPELINTR